MGRDLWYAYGMLGPGQSPETFEKSLWQLLGNMASKAVDEKRLHAAKRSIVAASVFSQDSLYLRAKEIGRMEVVGVGAANRDLWLDAIRGVTAPDSKQVMGRWIQKQRSTTGTLLPEVKS